MLPDRAPTTPELQQPSDRDLRRYDRGRRLDDKAFRSSCYAPTVSMYFDQFGNVRACCQNTSTLMGNVAEQSIRDIWSSAATTRLRDALEHHDLSEGCGFCAWQVDQGDESIVFARGFDLHPVAERAPAYPVQMEFSMTNSCNLQCVMCNGDWSSAIRVHRERRAPLAAVYGDEFFDQLAEFLPRLRKVNILGGEPFLGAEPLRLLGMLAELDHPPEVAVTTNGTQWSDRIQALCERLPISFVLSLDGITRSTYESIRVGADFDEVMTNLDRFDAVARRHGTTVSLAHCLMVPNWHEFAALLAFAERRGYDVGINEVLYPGELSLFQLDANRLRRVVDGLERDPMARDLRRHRGLWEDQLSALRHRLDRLDAGEAVAVRPWSSSDAVDLTWRQRAATVLGEWGGGRAPAMITLRRGATPSIECDPQDLVNEIELSGAHDVAQALDALRGVVGPDHSEHPRHTDFVHDIELNAAPDRRTLALRVVWREEHDGETEMLVAHRPPRSVPVDARVMLERWSDPGSVARLTTQGDPERLLSADDRLAVLTGAPAAASIGRTTDAVLQDIVMRAGGASRRLPGPSGYPSDHLFELGRPEEPPWLELRVLADPEDGQVDILLGWRRRRGVVGTFEDA